MALARDASLTALDTLLEAIMNGNDNDAANAAVAALAQHADWRHINVICSVWALTRHPTLGRLIAQHGWIANAPPDARYSVPCISGNSNYSSMPGQGSCLH
jgi:hypothetical protein